MDTLMTTTTIPMKTISRMSSQEIYLRVVKSQL